MTRHKVFIASSSEGLDVVKALRILLLQELGESAEVDPWTREFELSATYIESLEKASRETDFAVLVLTPDDVTTSREVEKFAPRDNVVFELGLFIGSLGRERCIIVHEQRPDLKLPTDLLGVKAATFKKPADNNLKVALDALSLSISEHITKLGSKRRLSPHVFEAHDAIRSFSDRITGAWWERLTGGQRNWISFLQIEFDDIFTSVYLKGRSYDVEGTLVAHWKSIVVRIIKEEKKLLYHWQGWHPSSPYDRFHGFGEMEFEGSEKGKDAMTRGHGKFWAVDEVHPEKTVIIPIELRRSLDKAEISTMTEGKETDLRQIVMKTLREW